MLRLDAVLLMVPPAPPPVTMQKIKIALLWESDYNIKVKDVDKTKNNLNYYDFIDKANKLW